MYLKASQDPKEYTQAQTLLKQMEIESMNFFESSEYGQNKKEGDQVRKRIQKHKKEFDSVRKQWRQTQQSFDQQAGKSTSRTGAASEDIENRQVETLVKQKRQLEDARTQAYEMEDLAVGMKSNLKGQG